MGGHSPIPLSAQLLAHDQPLGQVPVGLVLELAVDLQRPVEPVGVAVQLFDRVRLDDRAADAGRYSPAAATSARAMPCRRYCGAMTRHPTMPTRSDSAGIHSRRVSWTISALGEALHQPTALPST
jgi:hypothetical protein